MSDAPRTGGQRIMPSTLIRLLHLVSGVVFLGGANSPGHHWLHYSGSSATYMGRI